MSERINYGLVRKAAEQALETIPAQVPTINAPGSVDHDIVPPANLQQFSKLVFTPEWMELLHQTPPGDVPHIETRVKREAAKLIVEESVRGGEHTEVEFVDRKFVGAVTWNGSTQTRIESAKRENLRRIKRTLRHQQ